MHGMSLSRLHLRLQATLLNQDVKMTDWIFEDGKEVRWVTMMNGEEHLYLDCHDWICVFKNVSIRICFHTPICFSFSMVTSMIYFRWPRDDLEEMQRNRRAIPLVYDTAFG